MRAILLTSIDELTQRAVQWNALWQTSDAVLPTLRAELIAGWMRRFAPDRPFYALAIEADDRLLAALPLHASPRLRPLRTAVLTSNDWSFCGDLLLDKNANAAAVLDRFIAELRRLPFDLLWLDPIRFNRPYWEQFRTQLKQAGRPAQWLERYQTAVIPLHGDSAAVIAGWKKNEFKNIQRRFKKYYLSNLYRFSKTTEPDEIAKLLPECFRLENASWKGGAGGSILQNKMDDFFLQQAQTLAREGLFRLYTLVYEDELIAFRYCLTGPETVCSMKTSFAPDRREFAPGQILQYLINKELLEDSSIRYFDCMGILGPHQLVWSPEPDTVGQLVLPLSGSGRVFFSLYDRIMPWIRRRREKRNQKTDITEKEHK